MLKLTECKRSPMQKQLLTASITLALFLGGCSNTLSKEEAQQEMIQVLAECTSQAMELMGDQDALKDLDKECKEKIQDIKDRTAD